MNLINHFIPTRLLFGPGSLEQLASCDLPGKKALIVITNGKSIRTTGTLGRVEKLLQGRGILTALYDKITPNPEKAQVMEGAAFAREQDCDFVIGLGGGSPIDASKAIAVMATNPGDYWDYISGGTGSANPLIEKPLPIVAITTTAGTGTEVDPWTVVTHNGEKIGYGCDGTFPAVAIVDPELMVSVPPMLTAFQGFDALFHAVECFLANIATPISRLFSLKSIELVVKSLPTAVRDGKNIEARADVALANTLSGFCESTSCCTSEHSLAHAIGGFFPNVPHGAALISVSLEWFKFFAARLPEEFATMAKQVGKTDFVEVLSELQEECGVSDLKLSEYGIKMDDMGRINESAWFTMGGLFDLDQVKMTKEDSLGILQRSYR